MSDRHPVIDILEERKQVVVDKAHDYAASRWDDNFVGTAHLAGVDPEQVFHVLVGVKVERLRSLLTTGKDAPKNESVDDTLTDLATYADLWLAYRREQRAVTVQTPGVIEIPEGGDWSPEQAAEFRDRYNALTDDERDPVR